MYEGRRFGNRFSWSILLRIWPTLPVTRLSHLGCSRRRYLEKEKASEDQTAICEGIVIGSFHWTNHFVTTVNPGYNEPGYNEFRPIVKETALSGQYLVQSNEVRDITIPISQGSLLPIQKCFESALRPVKCEKNVVRVIKRVISGCFRSSLYFHTNLLCFPARLIVSVVRCFVIM